MRHVIALIGLLGCIVTGLVGMGLGCSQTGSGQKPGALPASAQSSRLEVIPTSQRARLPQLSNADLFYVPIGDSVSLGPASALVTAVLFADLTSRASAQAFAQLKALQKRDASPLRIVLKHYPRVRPQDTGMQAAVLAEWCRQHGKWAEFVERVFGLTKGTGPIQVDLLLRIIGQLGLETQSATAALNDSTRQQAIVTQRRLAARVGLRRAPGLFLNGRRITLDENESNSARSQRIADNILRAQQQAQALLARGFDPQDLYQRLIRRGRKSAWIPQDLPLKKRSAVLDAPAELSAQEQALALSGEGPSLGQPQAPVKLVMYVDLACSFCGQMIDNVHQLQRHFGSQVFVTIRHVPDKKKRSQVQDALVLLHSLRQKPAYWSLVQKVFSEAGHYDRNTLLTWASELGADSSLLKKQLEHPSSILEQLRQHQQTARKLGVVGSPYLFINAKRIQGATGLAVLRAAVEAELVKQSQPTSIPIPG